MYIGGWQSPLWGWGWGHSWGHTGRSRGELHPSASHNSAPGGTLVAPHYEHTGSCMSNTWKDKRAKYNNNILLITCLCFIVMSFCDMYLTHVMKGLLSQSQDWYLLQKRWSTTVRQIVYFSEVVVLLHQSKKLNCQMQKSKKNISLSYELFPVDLDWVWVHSEWAKTLIVFNFLWVI